MGSRLMVVLALPVLVLASILQPVTIRPADSEPDSLTLARSERGRGDCEVVRAVGRPFRPLVGTLDTVGGTTYDWQTGMPAFVWLANAPNHGLHVTWMYSQELVSTNFADRNMRYNYYDYATRNWAFNDPDLMLSGVNAFAERSGCGNIDCDPATGVAIVGRHTAAQSPAPMHPDIARGLGPGSEFFEYAEGTPRLDGYQWPPISVGQSGIIHMFPITPTYQLAYSRVVTWPTFDPLVTPFWPDPGFPSQNIAASKVSDKVCVAWENSAAVPEDAYFSVSGDGGATWPPSPDNLPPPVAFGGDTVTSFHITSIYPWYDRQDRLHFVANVMPIVHDTSYIIPAEIWHWCAASSPEWTEIHRAGCAPENLQASVGYNAIYACRPSIGEDSRGNLYATWEQFDSANVEPLTQYLRADVFAAASTDGGLTWLPAVKLTDAGTTSVRFPCVPDLLMPGEPDTFCVRYMVDVVCGFFVQGQGPATQNPMVVQKVPVTELGVQWPAVEEGSLTPDARRFTLDAQPNPFRASTRIEYALPKPGEAELAVYDAGGRLVRTLASGWHVAGRVSAPWNGTGEGDRPVGSGVYVCRYQAGGQQLSKKLVLRR